MSVRDSIIFWIDAGISSYCVANYLQKKNTSEFFAIIDITEKPKKFFSEQRIVDFKKFWFYHDHVKNLDTYDINYLKRIEQTYELNIMELISNDRFFSEYNNFHKFGLEEMLSIIEQECRFYESVLQETLPKFCIIHEPALRNQQVFYQICRKLGVRVLILNYANYQSRCYISDEPHKLKKIKSQSTGKIRDFIELQKQLDINPVFADLTKLHNNIRKSKTSKINAALKFLLSNNTNLKTHYTYFGRTKIRVLWNEIIFSIKRTIRKRFIDNNFIKDINSYDSFIFFPLNQEPERSLLIAAPFQTNQVENIRNIVKSMPVELKLLVKEHPTQGPARGWRKISTYKEILNIPNVVLVHPSVSSRELIKKCSLTITIAGTASLEAAFFQKPSIIFSDYGYDKISSIKKIKGFDELRKTIKDSLVQDIKENGLNSFIELIEENSFYFDFLKFEIDIHKWFYFEGNLVDVYITTDKMIEFLITHNTELNNLAEEYLKEMIKIDTGIT